MMPALLVLGCGGHGRVVAEAAMDSGYDKIAFLDDAPPEPPQPGVRVLGPLYAIERLAPEWPAAIVAIGDAALRLKLFETLRRDYATPNIIHPSAVISRSAQLGSGIFIGAGAIVGTGARIDNAAIINTGARIDHDCHIGPGSHIAPGATLSGNVTVGARTWLGTGCTIKHGIVIDDDVIVGVGAAVVSNLPRGKTYVGVPARHLTKAP
jgi:sugar O-acyltransferase (sialic acid O-acetyltransferase NeuD family)